MPNTTTAQASEAALVQIIQQHQEISAASAALAFASSTTQALLALPDHFKLCNLEAYQPLRRRMAGLYETHSLMPFADYIGQHNSQDSAVFVDADTMTALAVLDLGHASAPGHGDHRARLQLRKTAAYKALLGIVDLPRSQKAMAEFFEDWGSIAELEFFADTTSPEEALGEAIPRRRAIAALRAVDIKTTTAMEGRVEQLSSSLSAFEQVKASSKETLPASIYFGCLPYADLAERTFVLRLSVTASDNGPMLTLRIQNEEQHIEEMGEELAELVTAAIAHSAAGVPVRLGSYQKTNLAP